MTEAELLAAVIDLAHVRHWRIVHFRPAMTARGWRTPVQGDGVGFPDALLVRGERLLAVELKADGAKLRPEQASWLNALQIAGAETAVWRPANLHDAIVAALG